jgi:hypothetical protein
VRLATPRSCSRAISAGTLVTVLNTSLSFFLIISCLKAWSIQKFNLGAYAPATGKTYVKILKKLIKNLRLCLNILCVHANFHERLTFFVTVKKTKKVCRTKPFLNTTSFLHMTQKMSVFRGTTFWAYRTSRRTHQIFCLKLLTFPNIFKLKV